MDFAVARRRMVREQVAGRGVRDARVIDVMGRIPRHEFVDPDLSGQAYEDHPHSIGFQQTISQPYMVAVMTEQLQLKGNEKVLEIGTGSGYQTAILAELAREVYTVERIGSLSHRARRTLYRLGYMNVSFRVGDGTLGWSEEAPFDAILAAAGTPQIPGPLLDQLAEGGRLVIPRGDEGGQQLVRVSRKEGRWNEEVLMDCRFVKLRGQHGWG